MKIATLVSAIVALVACGGSPEPTIAEVGVLNELSAPSTIGAWRGLIKPEALAVAEDGLVYVADNGDSKIRIFDHDGSFQRELGGLGSGPGEFGTIRGLIVFSNSLIVFDGMGTRFFRLSLAGEHQAAVATSGVGEESVAGLGGDRIVVASSSRWSMPAPAGAGAWPLARVLDTNGAPVADIGDRAVLPNPFAAHILNFVLPAGSSDGQYVWLAYLNNTDVLLHSMSDGSIRRISRSVPFRWKRMPADFMPSANPPEPGKPFIPPFDAISYGVVTDRTGRAYVLTALESSRESGGQPQVMGIDVLNPDSTEIVRRYRVNGYFTHIGVSPDARRIYLLDSSRGSLHMFEGPQ